MNSISGGIGIQDGILKYWYDNQLLIDYSNVVMRTANFPDMKFNQFLIAPYIGDGSPIDQTMWVDELTVASSRPLIKSIENENNSKIILNINPFNILNITNPTDKNCSIVLYDLLGNKISDVYSGKMNVGNFSFDLNNKISEIANGVYLIIFKSENECISKRFFHFK